MSERVFILGAGNVGRGLSRAFHVSGVDVVGLHGRRPSDFATSSGSIPRRIADANVVLLAVRDAQIDAAVQELLVAQPQSGTVVLHTSGTAEPVSFTTLPAHGLTGGTFHPLVPFAHTERVPEYMRHGWVGIDGDAQAQAASRRLAAHLGSRTLEIPAGNKARYHAAAVIASNFPVVLAGLASELLHEVGIPERSAEQAVHSLMTASVANLEDSTAEQALTGPIVRGDVDMVRKHLAALNKSEPAETVYRQLSQVALMVAERRGVDGKTLTVLQNLLERS